MRQTCIALAVLLTASSCDSEILIPVGPSSAGLAFYAVSIRLEPSETLGDGRLEIGPDTRISVEMSESFDPDSINDAVLVSLDGRSVDGETISSGPSTLTWASSEFIVGSIDVDISPALRPQPGSEGGAGRSVDPDGEALGGISLPFSRVSVSVPPSPPSTIDAAALGPSAIRVEWSGASDNTSDESRLAARLSVRDAGDGALVVEIDTARGSLQAVVGGLEPETAYEVSVAAIDELENLGEGSSPVRVTTEPEVVPDTTPPDFAGVEEVRPPEGSSARELELRWNRASNDRDTADTLRYRVYPATASGAQDFDCESCARTSEAGATELVVDGLDPDTEYFFVVRALDSAGNEDPNQIEVGARTRLSYLENIQPILTELPPAGVGCSQVGCHGGGNPSGGLSLDTHEKLITGGFSTQFPPRTPIVVPFEKVSDAMESLLIRRIDEANLGFQSPRMPFGLDPLTDDQLDRLRRWISQGALDN